MVNKQNLTTILVVLPLFTSGVIPASTKWSLEIQSPGDKSFRRSAISLRGSLGVCWDPVGCFVIFDRAQARQNEIEQVRVLAKEDQKMMGWLSSPSDWAKCRSRSWWRSYWRRFMPICPTWLWKRRSSFCAVLRLDDESPARKKVISSIVVTGSNDSSIGVSLTICLSRLWSLRLAPNRALMKWGCFEGSMYGRLLDSLKGKDNGWDIARRVSEIPAWSMVRWPLRHSLKWYCGEKDGWRH